MSRLLDGILIDRIRSTHKSGWWIYPCVWADGTTNWNQIMIQHSEDGAPYCAVYFTPHYF